MTRRSKPYGRKAFVKDYIPLLDDETVRRQRFDFPRKEIEPLLAQEQLSFDDRISVSTGCVLLGSYFGLRGIALCFSDVNAGWRLMWRSLLYNYWRVKISRRVWDFWEVRPGRRKHPFDEAYRPSVNAAFSLAIAPSEANWYLELLESSLTDGSLDWSTDNVFPAYLLRLHRKRKGEDDFTSFSPDPKSGERVFGDLIDEWNDEEHLARAIGQMCDYHLLRNQGARGAEWIEFDAPLAVLNPVEIHALEAVRSELGLSTPKLEHELLQPPFYPIPETAKQITTEEILAEDDLLRRIVEMNQAWCDGLED